MNYQKQLKKLLNENIIDIIVFGSFVKGGAAKDIDIGLVLKNKTNNVLDIRKKIELMFKKKTDIQIITIDSLYSSIWLTLIKEGFSVKNNKFLSELYKVKPSVLYKFSLMKLNNVQKVQFERGLKKVLKNDGAILTRSVVLIPLTMKNEMVDFLKNWNIYYESREYELLPVQRKDEFI